MITPIGQLALPGADCYLKMWQTSVAPATRLLQDHRHMNFEIARVVEGEGTYIAENTHFPVKPGDVFVFAGNKPHWISRIGAQGLRIVNLHFSPSFFREACTVSARYPNLVFAHSRSFCPRIPKDQAASLHSILDRIQAELIGQETEYELCIRAQMDLLFACLMRSYGYYSPGEGTHTAAEKLLQGLAYIDAHFVQNLTLEEIAAKSGLSPNYYTALFHECFHMKLWDYVLAKRVDLAKQLLTGPKAMNVLDIALACGFNNTANLNRVFLRFTGLTPRQYRHPENAL